MVDLPERARVVIVGGGVIGASIAYHLVQAGEREVVLLERDRLTSGTTWHAAGLMTCFGSFSRTLTELRLSSRELYSRLEAETGQSTGFRPVGLVEAAADESRLEEYRRVAVFQRRLGLEVTEVSPAEMATLFPPASTEGLLGGFYVPGDGRVNPVDLTMALVRGARAGGVRVAEGVRVTGVVTRPRAGVEEVTGVKTDHGRVECDVVVNAAGMWARELAQRSGVTVPNQAAEHYYLVTEPIEGVHPDLPVFEDPSSYGYYREEGGGLLVGLFEPVAAPWRVDGVPPDFSFGTIPPDTDRVAPFLERSMARVPVVQDAGIRTFFCGPESFTPDLRPAVGEAPGIRGYFVCAGMNSVGILSAGGLGRLVAHWVVSGRPDVDVTGIDVARFREWQLDPRHRAARTTEILGTVYAAHPPGTEPATSRGVFRSPVQDRVEAAGACLQDVSGWEAPAWYAGPGERPSAEPGWGRQPWFARWEAEHHAVREAVGLVDLSCRTRFSVRGPDALAVLDRLSAGDLGRDARSTPTPWLGTDGGVDAEVTVIRVSAQDLLVVASAAAHGRVAGMLLRGRGAADATVTDVTEDLALLCLQGPRSRALLRLADPGTDWSGTGFPLRSAQRVQVAGTEVLAVRTDSVGELGWELHVPAGDAPAVWDTVLAQGARHGLVPVGLAAVGSLRLEHGRLEHGEDLDPTDDVWAAGLGSAVALDKPGGFIGRSATLAARDAGPPTHRLVRVVLRDPQPLLVRGEVLLRDGEPVGDVRSGSYGWTLRAAVGIGSVENDHGVTERWLADGRWEVDVAGVRHRIEVALRRPDARASARVRE